MKRLLHIVESFLVCVLVLLALIAILVVAVAPLRDYCIEAFLGIDRMGMLIVCAACAVVVLLGITVLAFGGDNSESREVCIKSGPDGMVSISEEALVALAGGAVRIVPAVKDYEVELVPPVKGEDNEGIAFDISASMYQTSNIPAVTEKIREDVIDVVEGRTGIKVTGVNIHVKDSVREQEQTKLTRVK